MTGAGPLAHRELNNTYIYDFQSDCSETVIFSDQICEVRRGGYFVEGQSSTWQKASTEPRDLISAGGAPQEITTAGTEAGVKDLVSTSSSGTERLAVGTAKDVTLPIGIPRQPWDKGYTILHPLGLGSNSTYLSALVKAGQIPSRVWSIFWGRMWTGNADVDGQVVLGGYDQEKVIGRNFTQPLDYSEQTGCWTGMKVTVSDIIINFRNGTDFGIMTPNSALQVCIVPHRQLLLEAPNQIVDDFEKAAGMSNFGTSSDLHWAARKFNDSDSMRFNGDVTFQLDTGLQVRIPNSQFFTPIVDIARNGSRVSDDSKRQLLMSGAGDRPATLGRYFLTGAYLMVDHEAKSFTMWQANPSTSSKLVAVSSQQTEGCPDGEEEEGSGTQGGDQNNQSSGTNVGAIAGGVVGGVAVLVAVGVVAARFLARRRRNATNGDRRSHEEAEAHDAEKNSGITTGPTDDDPSNQYYAHVPGVEEADSVGRYEVQGDDIYQPQGRPAELAADR